PVMKAASELGREPRKLAEETAEELEVDSVEDIEVAGPGYLNFMLSRTSVAEAVEKMLEDERMGVEEREGKMLVEFSSP
ncbi:MAG: arginine--tRNA ligase, partial [Candidatus Nanohaloarchaea archaeon]